MALVSIVVPYYRQAAFVAQSIRSALSQTHRDIEVIAVDDNSPDESGSIVDAIEDERLISIHRKTNGGPSVAINDGIKRSQGDYIALLGGDDVAESWRIQHQLDYLVGRSSDAVFSLPLLIDADGRELNDDILPIFGNHPASDDPVLTFRHLVVNGNTFCAPSALIKRDVFDELGMFDPNLIHLQDYDYWMKMAASGYRSSVGERRVVRYRQHTANLSSRQHDDEMRAELMTCITEAISGTASAVLAAAFHDLIAPDKDEVDIFDRAIIAMMHGNTAVNAFGHHLIFETLASKKRLEHQTRFSNPYLTELLSLSPNKNNVLCAS